MEKQEIKSVARGREQLLSTSFFVSQNSNELWRGTQVPRHYALQENHFLERSLILGKLVLFQTLSHVLPKQSYMPLNIVLQITPQPPLIVSRICLFAVLRVPP